MLEIYPQWYSTENNTLQGNVGIEKVKHSPDWMKYYAKPSISYAIDDNWALHGGLGLYYTDYPTIDNNIEIRPYQGISHFYALSEKWKLTSYLRAEERFQDTKKDSLRLRLRFRTGYTLNPLSKNNSWHKFTFGVEGLKSYYQDESDTESIDTYDYESRVALGMERSLSKKDKLRFELAWKYKAPLDNISSSSVSTIYFKLQYYPMWGNILKNRLFERAIDE